MTWSVIYMPGSDLFDPSRAFNTEAEADAYVAEHCCPACHANVGVPESEGGIEHILDSACAAKWWIEEDES